MDTKPRVRSDIDMDKYRLRRFVDRLVDIGEVEVHAEPVPLTKVSEIIEGTDKAVLFKQAGPERIELAAKTAGNRKRLAAAFDVSEDKLYDEYWKRFAAPQPIVEIPTDEAPVHEVVLTGKDIDLTKLPFYPHHAYDGSCYLSSAIDYTIDPATGRRNVGCRRLSLPQQDRDRHQRDGAVGPEAHLHGLRRARRRSCRSPSPSARIRSISSPRRRACRTTSWASSPHFAARRRAVVKSVTNDILVPADAEITLEGYLDERGYVEPEGPYGEYMGYYGAIHLDPVFHCTAITMRRDALHLTLLHGSAFVLDQTDSAVISAMRTEAEAMRILKSTVREPVSAYLRSVSGGSNTLRVSIKQRSYGEAKAAIAALFGGIMRLKHVYVFDEDIDIHDDQQVEWAMGTRFQADQDLMVLQGMVGMTMDPSLQGRRTGAKAGFDCTKPFGRDGQIPLTRSAAKVFKGPARFQTVEQALGASPMFYADIVEAIGSQDGREVASALDALRQNGKLGRDRDGRYHMGAFTAGVTGIVGQLYHDPNEGT